MSEELLFHFHSWLYKLNEGDVSNHFDISSSETEGKSKFQVVKTIRNLFESFEKTKTGSDFLVLLKDATALSKMCHPPSPGR